MDMTREQTTGRQHAKKILFGVTRLVFGNVSGGLLGRAAPGKRYFHILEG
jgi:hypothetical protein